MSLNTNQINYGLINSLTQKWLDDNDILMYTKHNEGKSVVEIPGVNDLVTTTVLNIK